MANEPEKIDSGVFIDTKTDEVVHEKPEEGVQIVPEGGVLDDLARGHLAAVGHSLETRVDDDKLETAEDPSKTVTSKSARGR